MKTRKPAVAGRFYPGTKDDIIEQFSGIYKKEKNKFKVDLANKTIIGGVVPHAGYMFSAYQAMHFFEILKLSEQKPDTIVILNPNHTGYGAGIAIDDNEAWETPMGKVSIDKEFYSVLSYEKSPAAHKYEHSGEVMLPFLQHFLEYSFKIVPITMSAQTIENAKAMAKKIYKAAEKLKRKIVVIASSDFSHYVEPSVGFEQDELVVKNILNFNTEKVYHEVKTKNISVCGFGPIMTLMEYSKLITPSHKAEVLQRGHSGQIIPSSEVVDYISILFYQE